MEERVWEWLEHKQTIKRDSGQGRNIIRGHTPALQASQGETVRGTCI